MENGRINRLTGSVCQSIVGIEAHERVNWKDTKWSSEIECMELKYGWVVVKGNDKIYRTTDHPQSG